MKVWICVIFGEYETFQKVLLISSGSGFWFHSKKARLFFHFKHTSRFCQENRCFCIFLHWPSTSFFSYEKENDSVRGRELWKFNKSLISDMLVYWNYEKKKTNFWNFVFIRWPEYNWWTSKMGIFEIWDSKIHKKKLQRP